MKLKTCLEIGLACELDTVEESYHNIVMHSSNLFAYTELNDELDELTHDYNGLLKTTQFDKGSSVKEVLDWLKDNNQETIGKGKNNEVQMRKQGIYRKPDGTGRSYRR